MRAPLALHAALAFAAALAHRSPARAQGLDRPTALAWPARRGWDAAAERSFAAWVTTLGRAVAAHRCTSLQRCLADARVNPLHEVGSRPLRIRADCADVPYLLRAYFAYRQQLPFVFTARLRHPRRPLPGGTRTLPAGTLAWTDFRTPRRLLEALGSVVHSGYFRTDTSTSESDYYPVSIAPGAIHPGTVYYDPNGHVLVVYEVHPDGEVLLVDGHPDGSFTARRFSPRLAIGTARTQGGFQNFRPVLWSHGVARRAPNAALSDYDPRSQYDHARHTVDGVHATYHQWVRARLASARR